MCSYIQDLRLVNGELFTKALAPRTLIAALEYTFATTSMPFS
jgi:hypothetical protein